MYSLEIYVEIYFFSLHVLHRQITRLPRQRLLQSLKLHRRERSQSVFWAESPKAFDGNFCALPLSPTIKAFCKCFCLFVKNAVHCWTESETIFGVTKYPLIDKLEILHPWWRILSIKPHQRQEISDPNSMDWGEPSNLFSPEELAPQKPEPASQLFADDDEVTQFDRCHWDVSNEIDVG